MNTTIDPKEIDKFEAMADEWWSATGKFKPLHKFNPIRISYIREKLINPKLLRDKNAIPFSSLLSKWLHLLS